MVINLLKVLLFVWISTLLACSPGQEEYGLEKNTLVIRDNVSIRALEGNPQKLVDFFQNQLTVKVITSDGNWTKNIYLPSAGIIDGKRFQLKVMSTYAVNLHYNKNVVTFGKGSRFGTVFQAGSWR